MDAREHTAQPRRDVGYDALRAFAIVTVVAIHSLMPLRDILPDRSPALLIDDLLHYAVPLFVFISGALVWGRYPDKCPDERDRFFLDRVETVGLPYALWAVGYLVLRSATSADPLRVLAQAPSLLASGHVWYHLYFVPMLFAFYLLTPVMAPAIARRPDLALVVTYGLRVFVWPSLSTSLRAGAPELVWSFATHVMTHLPHMVLGAWFARRLAAAPRASRWWPALTCCGASVLLAESAGWIDPSPGAQTAATYALAMAATVLGLVLAGRALAPTHGPLSGIVRRGAALSFGVYLVHPLILEAIWGSARAAGAGQLLVSPASVPLVLALATAASFWSAALLARSPRTSWLVGIRARRS